MNLWTKNKVSCFKYLNTNVLKIVDGSYHPYPFVVDDSLKLIQSLQVSISSSWLLSDLNGEFCNLCQERKILFLWHAKWQIENLEETFLFKICLLTLWRGASSSGELMWWSLLPIYSSSSQERLFPVGWYLSRGESRISASLASKVHGFV